MSEFTNVVDVGKAVVVNGIPGGMQWRVNFPTGVSWNYAGVTDSGEVQYDCSLVRIPSRNTGLMPNLSVDALYSYLTANVNGPIKMLNRSDVNQVLRDEDLAEAIQRGISIEAMYLLMDHCYERILNSELLTKTVISQFGLRVFDSDDITNVASAEVLRVISYVGRGIDGYVDKMVAIAKSEKCTQDMLVELAGQYNFFIRSAVASNPNTPLNTLIKLVSVIDESVQTLARSNPTYAQYDLVGVSSDEAPKRLSNSLLPSHFINRFVEHAPYISQDVAVAISKHPNASTAVLLKLVKSDYDPSVIINILHHRDCSPSVADKVLDECHLLSEAVAEDVLFSIHPNWCLSGNDYAKVAEKHYSPELLQRLYDHVYITQKSELAAVSNALLSNYNTGEETLRTIFVNMDLSKPRDSFVVAYVSKLLKHPNCPKSISDSINVANGAIVHKPRAPAKKMKRELCRNSDGTVIRWMHSEATGLRFQLKSGEVYESNFLSKEDALAKFELSDEDIMAMDDLLESFGIDPKQVVDKPIAKLSCQNNKPFFIHDKGVKKFQVEGSPLWLTKDEILSQYLLSKDDIDLIDAALVESVSKISEPDIVSNLPKTQNAVSEVRMTNDIDSGNNAKIDASPVAKRNPDYDKFFGKPLSSKEGIGPRNQEVEVKMTNATVESASKIDLETVRSNTLDPFYDIDQKQLVNFINQAVDAREKAKVSPQGQASDTVIVTKPRNVWMNRGRSDMRLDATAFRTLGKIGVGVPCFDKEPYLNDFQSCYVVITGEDGNEFQASDGSTIFGVTASAMRIMLYKVKPGADLGTATPYVWEYDNIMAYIGYPEVVNTTSTALKLHRMDYSSSPAVVSKSIEYLNTKFDAFKDAVRVVAANLPQDKVNEVLSKLGVYMDANAKFDVLNDAATKEADKPTLVSENDSIVKDSMATNAQRALVRSTSNVAYTQILSILAKSNPTYEKLFANKMVRGLMYNVIASSLEQVKELCHIDNGTYNSFVSEIKTQGLTSVMVGGMDLGQKLIDIVAEKAKSFAAFATKTPQEETVDAPKAEIAAVC